ncbi:MAG TPA: glutamine synthetase family protein [Polyangiaceae bacterium]|nr:glutamine synthetase family protein [Polyangiaceae bacterium]
MAKATPEEQALEKIRKSSASKFKVAITDIDGVLRGKYIHRSKLESALEGGFGFCNVVFGWDAGDVCYDNASYTGWHTGYPDALARLDLSTYREVPWDGGVPFLLGEFVDEHGHPLPICPRQLLKRVLARAAAAGFDVVAAFEYEFFHFRETSHSLAERGHLRPDPLTPGMFGYSLLRLNQSKEYVNALFDELGAFGVPIEGLHTETGPGVMEAAVLYADALEAADRAVLFKAGAKEIGHRFGIMPSFMAKWRADLPGCSGHIHQSLWASGKKNAFYGGSEPGKLSRTLEHYIAGQLHCLPEILPMFAPTINSYKRLVEGAWAPTKANWGIDNRTTALRAIPGSKKSSRLETRVNGSDSNPYLALAAAVASGLYGIENELPLVPAVKGNGYADREAATLPRNLAEATERFESSELAQSLFGPEFVAHFAASRRWEWRQYAKAVTDWELARYFEII